MFSMLLQTGDSVFGKWWNSLKTAVENADPVEVWAIVLISIGIVSLFFVIMFTEYKRSERESIKFTTIFIILTAVFLGFGIDLLLMNNGFW